MDQDSQPDDLYVKNHPYSEITDSVVEYLENLHSDLKQLNKLVQCDNLKKIIIKQHNILKFQSGTNLNFPILNYACKPDYLLVSSSEVSTDINTSSASSESFIILLIVPKSIFKINSSIVFLIIK